MYIERCCRLYSGFFELFVILHSFDGLGQYCTWRDVVVFYFISTVLSPGCNGILCALW